MTLLVMFATVLMAQVESGKVYRIVNGKYGTVISANPHSHKLACVTEGTAEDYQQMWKFEVTENGKYTIQNVYTKRYLQNERGTNVAYKTGNSLQTFAVTENASLKGYYNIDATEGGNWGLHCASDGQVVPWHYGPNDGEVSGTEWRFQQVNISEADMEAAFADYQKLEQTINNIDAIKEAATEFFADKTGLTLKEQYAQMSDDELLAAAAEMPETMQQILLKIKNNSWDEATREKEFRVYDYRPYSDPNKWAEVLYTRYFNRINNPTGICSKSDRDFIFVFVDDIPGGTTAYLAEMTGTGFWGNDTKLEAGLNIIPSTVKNGVLYIRYNCNTDTAGKKLADYPNLKVHIEGGYVNGFWSKERGHKNSDWVYMRNNMFKNPTAVQAVGDHTVLNFRTYEFLKECPNNIEGVINLWDFWNERQRHYMAIDKYYDWFNNKQLAMSDDNGFMDASNWRTHYNNNTLSTIVNYDLLIRDAGSSWGPNHEIGHTNQYAFEIVGTSEVSNNALTNFAIFDQGTHTSRGNDLQNQIIDFQNKIPYVVRGEKEYGQKLFSMTRMYFQLYLYFHAAKKDETFYPRLFERLRYDRLVGWGTSAQDVLDANGYYLGSMNALYDQLKFAEICCEVAQMDLSEFFEAWGFFIPMKNAFVGDYGHHYVYLHQADIDASKKRMQKYAKKGGQIMFLEDRVRKSEKKASPFSDGNGYRADYSDEVPAGVNSGKVWVGYYGQWQDCIDESVKAQGYYYGISKGQINIVEAEGAKGALGFKLYNGDTGELLTYTNLRAMTIPPAYLNSNLKVVAAQADGTDYVVPHISQGPEEMQYTALKNSYQAALQLKSRKATNGNEIGCYYPDALVELEEIYAKAKAAYDNKDTSERSYAEWSMLLDEECSRIKSNPKSQVQFEETAIAYLKGAKTYADYVLEYGSNSMLIKKYTANSAPTAATAQWTVEYAGKEGEYYIKNGNGYYISEFGTDELVQANVESPAAAAKFNIVFDNGRVIFPLVSNPNLTFGVNGSKDTNGNYVLKGMNASEDNAQWKGFVITDNSAAHYKSELENALVEANVIINEVLNIDSISTMNMFNSNIIVKDRNLESYAVELYQKYNSVKEDMENANMHKSYLTEFRNLFNKIEGTYKVVAPAVTKGNKIMWYRIVNKETGKYINASSNDRLNVVSSFGLSDNSLWSFASTGVAGEYKLYNAGNSSFAYFNGTKLYAAEDRDPAVFTITYDEENEAMVIKTDGKSVYEKSGYADLNNRSKSYWILEIAAVEENKEIADIITVIEGINAEGVANGNVYDMQGRKVTEPTRGIYIKDGKKVIVK